jgi:hypothetical protein
MSATSTTIDAQPKKSGERACQGKLAVSMRIERDENPAALVTTSHSSGPLCKQVVPPCRLLLLPILARRITASIPCDLVELLALWGHEHSDRRAAEERGTWAASNDEALRSSAKAFGHSG